MSSKKLLIVDDEPGIRESLQEYFELEGYTVSGADCGENALQILKQHAFDIVLSDVRMPRGDGRFLLRKIKEINIYSPIVVLMSGFTDLTLEEAFNEGARAVFTKPFHPQSMLSSLNSVSENRPNVIHFSKVWELDLSEKNLKNAFELKKLNFGQYGFFIPLGDFLPSVGDGLKLVIGGATALGQIRWVRHSDLGEKQKGFGFEIVEMNSDMEGQLKQLVDEYQRVSVIPSSI